jgi:hypothetical protein
MVPTLVCAQEGVSRAGPNVHFGSKADMCSATRDVRFVPIADIAPAANNQAADYLIAAFL